MPSHFLWKLEREEPVLCGINRLKLSSVSNHLLLPLSTTPQLPPAAAASWGTLAQWTTWGRPYTPWSVPRTVCYVMSLWSIHWQFVSYESCYECSAWGRGAWKLCMHSMQNTWNMPHDQKVRWLYMDSWKYSCITADKTTVLILLLVLPISHDS